MISAPAPARTAKPGGPVPAIGLPRWALALLFLGIWTVYGLLFGVRERARAVFRSEEVLPWSEALSLGMFQSYVVAVLAACALYAAHRMPLERHGWARNLALHAAIGAAVVFATGVLMHLAVPLVTDIPRQPLKQRFVGNIPAWSVIYVAMLGIGYGLDYFRRYRARALRASQLESQLARAQLEALKMQLHPHFLFNTLNSISALMHRDVAAADRMLSRLEDLLRMSLEKAQAQEVRLHEELRILEPYLEIEQARFGQRLRVVWDIEPEALEACVPHLILQPLIENAIKHGIAPRSTPGRIAIVARRAGERLELEVRDNGAGPLAPQTGAEASANGRLATLRRPRGGGVGLANTRARLAQLYDGAGHFEIAESPEGGTVARIGLPLRYAEPVG